MHIHFLDTFVARPSLVHASDPRLKFLLAIAFILTCGLTPIAAWPVYILLLVLILSLEILSNLGILYVLKRSLLALPFVLAALPIIFTAPGQALFDIQLLNIDLTVTQAGVERFISVGFKSWLSVQAAIMLAATTSFPDLLAAMRAVGVPRLLVAIFSLMWRYLFVLADEALRLVRARAARSSWAGQANVKAGRSFTWRAGIAGGMAGSLFLRALERSDRIYNAMLARGYDGELRAIPLERLKPSHWLVLTLGMILLGALLGLSLLFT